MSAYAELRKFLDKGETVEAIVFGDWGWGGYDEPDPAPVPVEKRGKVLTLRQARPYMQSWSFFGGFGAPSCYAVRVWTNKRVIWVTQYDGATGLDSSLRNPEECKPDMPGG